MLLLLGVATLCSPTQAMTHLTDVVVARANQQAKQECFSQSNQLNRFVSIGNTASAMTHI